MSANTTCKTMYTTELWETDSCWLLRFCGAFFYFIWWFILLFVNCILCFLSLSILDLCEWVYYVI